MISVSSDAQTGSSDWQTEFLSLLPKIESHLHHAFRHRDPASLEEAIVDGVVICMMSFKSLFERGRAESITGSNLAWFAAKQVRSGRGAECHLNSRNPLSRYARLRRAIRIESLAYDDFSARKWVDELAQDHRSTVLDLVAIRMDFTAWLATLCQRSRRVAAELGQGASTSEVARNHGVTAGRISQLRRELADSWKRFQHEPSVNCET